MADLIAIRNAIASNITNFTGLLAHGQAPDQVTPPCAVILPRDPYVNYASTMDGCLDFNFAVVLIISDAAPVDATQRALDAYLGIGQNDPNLAISVPQAIEQDNTLGGAAHFIQAVSAGRYGRVEYAGQTYFGAQINVIAGGI